MSVTVLRPVKKIWNIMIALLLREWENGIAAAAVDIEFSNHLNAW